MTMDQKTTWAMVVGFVAVGLVGALDKVLPHAFTRPAMLVAVFALGWDAWINRNKKDVSFAQMCRFAILTFLVILMLSLFVGIEDE